MRRPSLRELWWRPLPRIKVFHWYIPRLPRPLCRRCHEWDGNGWTMTCNAWLKEPRCPHRHHKLDVFFASGETR